MGLFVFFILEEGIGEARSFRGVLYYIVFFSSGLGSIYSVMESFDRRVRIEFEVEFGSGDFRELLIIFSIVVCSLRRLSGECIVLKIVGRNVERFLEVCISLYLKFEGNNLEIF